VAATCFGSKDTQVPPKLYRSKRAASRPRQIIPPTYIALVSLWLEYCVPSGAFQYKEVINIPEQVQWRATTMVTVWGTSPVMAG